MANFEVPIFEIENDVEHHPHGDRLSLLRIKGYTCISAKLDDGSHRYQKGDLVAYIPEDAKFPEWLLKRMDFWKEEENKGGLSGPDGNRLTALKIRKIVSQGVLYPIKTAQTGTYRSYSIETEHGWHILDHGIVGDPVMPSIAPIGRDVAELLGLTKWEPVIPEWMTGAMCGVAEMRNFDVESLQKYPDLFVAGELVEVTEKIHGVQCPIGYIPGLNHPDCFAGGDIYVTSKGFAAQGFAFKDVADNDQNLYVRMLRRLLDDGFAEKIKSLANGQPARLWCEIFGYGVQDLQYGTTAPQIALFEIKIGDAYLSTTAMQQAAVQLGIATVPHLGQFDYDMAVLEKLRDGPTLIPRASHIREGIVVRSLTGERRMAKFVSPKYLLRSGDHVTDFA